MRILLSLDAMHFNSICVTKSELKHAGEWIKAEYPKAVSDFFDFIGDGRDKIEQDENV